jgi:uncharacterized protein
MAFPLIDLRVPGAPKPARIGVAATWARRAVGLLATRRLDDPCGLWIKPCRSIHTVGMRYAIDIVFLRADGVVAKVVPELGPFRMAACREARTVLELRAGLAQRLGIAPGMALGLRA